jgi:hypothetical protein
MSVIGSVSMIKIGFTIAFKIANTTANAIAVQKSTTCMPERIFDNPKATIDVTMMRMMNFIPIILLQVTGLPLMLHQITTNS